MRHYIWILCCAAILTSCKSRDTVSVRGHVASCSHDTVYLEYISAAGVSVVDSTVTSKDGIFGFKIKLDGGEDAIYNVRVGGDVMTLLVSAGEKLDLHSICNNATNYEVYGSPGSLLIKELTLIMHNGINRMDSLRGAIVGVTAGDVRDSILSDYSRTYIRAKQEQIGFIVSNPGSLAAIYALYQRLPGDNVLFNGESDIIYYRTVADSVSVSHPNSPYLEPLMGIITKYDNKNDMMQAIDAAKMVPVNFPEINMPDIYGNKVKLSSLSDKVVLLYFWSAGSRECKEINMEFKEIYSKYAPDGFEIYQVSVDELRALWVTTVQDQRLPWISVSDLKGTASPTVGVYNITKVPTNFLFDRGSVVGRDIFGDELVAQLERILK